MIEARVVTEDDWPLWRELRLQALTEAAYAFGSRLADWQGDGDREERWRARLAEPGSYNLVASIDGRAVGMASGVPAEAVPAEAVPAEAVPAEEGRPGDVGIVELISMYVAPQGRGRGVGDFLVQQVERWARRIGAKELRLAVTEGNGNARALYERNGFRDTDELGDLMPDGVHRERVMAKSLVE